MDKDYWKAKMLSEYYILQHRHELIINTNEPTKEQLEDLNRIEHRLNVLKEIFE